MFNNQNFNSENVNNNNYDFNKFDYFDDKNIKYNSNNDYNFLNNNNNYKYNDYHYNYNYNEKYNSKRSNNYNYLCNKVNIKDYNNINNCKKYKNDYQIKHNYFNKKNNYKNHNYNDYFDEKNRNKKEKYKNKYNNNDNDENSDYDYNYNDFYSDGADYSSDDFDEEEYYEKLTLNDKNRYGYMYELPDINQRLIILDTEVTGRNRKDFNLLEVCAFEMINGKITNNKFHSFFKPKNHMTAQAIKKHRVPKKAFFYTPENEIDILLDMRWFIGTSLIITHNASYDLDIINRALERYDLPKISPYQYRCSMRIFLNYCPEYSVTFSKLNVCCKILKIKYRERRLHLASYDAFLVGKVMEKLYRDQADKNHLNKFILNNDESIEHKIDKENYMILKKNEDEDEEKENNNIENDNNINKLIENISDIKEEKKKEIKEIELNNFIDNNIENLIAKKEEEESIENFINENLENILSEMPKKEKNNLKENDSMGEFINKNLDEILFLLNNYDNEEYLRKKRKLN